MKQLMLFIGIILILGGCNNRAFKPGKSGDDNSHLRNPQYPKSVDTLTQSKIYKEKNLTDNYRVNQFIPKDYSVLFYETEDLNLDGIKDVVLVLIKNGEDSLSTLDNPFKRKFMILYGLPNQSYQLEIEKENLTYYYGYDGNFRDALAAIEVKPGTIIMDHYGGFNQRWARTTVFKYNATEKSLYLYKDTYATFEATDTENTSQEKIFTEKEFGKIKINEFDIYDELD